MAFKLNAEVIQHFLNKGFYLYIFEGFSSSTHVVLRNNKFFISFSQIYYSDDSISDSSDVSIYTLEDLENGTFGSGRHAWFDSFSCNDDVYSFVDEIVEG